MTERRNAMTTTEAQQSFDAHRDSVYRWAYRVLRNHHDAMDVTQEVFVKWWRAQRESNTPRHPVSWLRRVTVNHSINLCRARRTHALDIDDVDMRAPAGPTDGAEQRRIGAAVADALAGVSEQQRTVLFAKTYDGCTFAQIAEEMELSIGTVKTHYLRALSAVRRKLSEAGIMPGETP